jgi:hypothetical protein
MKITCFILILIPVFIVFPDFGINARSFKIVGTGVKTCYDNIAAISCPISADQRFYGQFSGSDHPAFKNNGNGTVTDLVTGLMWQNNPDANGNNNGKMERSDKLTREGIQAKIISLNADKFAGYNNWRIPSIKELYSLTNWNGTDPSGYRGMSTAGLTPFIDTLFFPFAWGLVDEGERLIDSQYASGTLYKEKSFAGHDKLFGFNFADGRIKGYDVKMPGGREKTFSFIAVRGNPAYGVNNFTENDDQTITDHATGLIWAKDDSKFPMNWEQALAWAQQKNEAGFCGHNDWRLPNAKELQSIVDYSRSPGSTGSAAIDPVFNCTRITNEAGKPDWPWYWTSTTHISYNGTSYGAGWAVYICFGRAAGWMRIGPDAPYFTFIDVHGAGAQRSSPKNGTFHGNYIGVDSLGKAVYGLGPQGDIIRVNNYVRLVRTAKSTSTGYMENYDPDKIKFRSNLFQCDWKTKKFFFLSEPQGAMTVNFNIQRQSIDRLTNRRFNSGDQGKVWNFAQACSGMFTMLLHPEKQMASNKIMVLN